MQISTELPGTEQDIAIFTDDDLLLSGTIKDETGTALDLTDCTLKMLIKQDVSEGTPTRMRRRRWSLWSPGMGPSRLTSMMLRWSPGGNTNTAP